MRLRALVPAAAAAACLAASGCGDSGAGSPLDEALGYLPENAPFVAAVSTDIEGDQYEALDSLLKKFPFGGQVKDQVRQSIESQGADFEKDVRPLLGNDLVVGAPDVASLQRDDEQVIVAIETKDGGKLKDLIEKEGGQDQARKVGESNGATLYEGQSSFSAVKDDVLVVADSREQVEKALDQRDGDRRMTEERLDAALAGLPKDGLVEVAGDLQALLRADPDTADARKVKWVGALRTFGATGRVSPNEAALDFNVKTEGSLSAADLPFATGGQAPRVPGRETNSPQVGFGLRNPAQVVKFGEQTGQAVDPGGFGDYQAGKNRLNKQLDIDVDRDLIAQFEGDASVAVDPDGTFGARADVRDPAALDKTVRKLARELPRLARSTGGSGLAISPPKGDEDLYGLATPDGQRFVFGVTDDVFVVANNPDRAAALAKQPTTVPSGAQGSIAMNADAGALASEVISRASGGGIGGALGGSLFTGPLGDLNGSIQTEPGGMRGRLRLAID